MRVLSRPDAPLRVATYNIHGCVGVDGKRDIGRIAEVLAEIDADIVGVQEAESRPSRSAADQAQELARRLGMELAEGPILLEGGGHYGNALLSRLPLRVERRERLPQRTGEPRAFLHGVAVSASGVTWHVIVTHLSLGPVSRRMQLRMVTEELGTRTPAPAVLLADLNEWNACARGLTRLRRAADLLRGAPTFPSHRPLFRLDRIALRGCRALADARPHRTELSRIASDHLPLVADVARVN